MYKNIYKLGIITFIGVSTSLSGCFLKKKKPAPTPVVNKPVATQKPGALKPYRDIISAKAKTDSGLFAVHKVDEKYFYEIADTLFGREMLAVTRYVKTPAVDGVYGGEEINEQVWVWEKRDKQVLLRVQSYANVAADSSEMFQSVRNSNLAPILAVFDIKSLGKDSNGVVIDVSDFFNKDINAIGLSPDTRTAYKITRLDESRSYIDTIKSFPINIETRTVKTYLANNPPVDNSLGSVTVELNTSMVLLPKVPMQARLYDQRVGYFSRRQTDYGIDAQKATVTRYVARWRLEPKDSAAYARGELVEPKKQIVYYIDPATPKKWRPYLIEGVKDWNAAFEAAGFKNAITCLEAPTDDPDWSPEDARYSVIRYFASNIANAYGPHISDPRSGEIIESDIGWYHNVMNLVRNWFFVQTAAVNPEARMPKFKDEVMGQLIRFVSSHEIGHTLGLAHNFGSSVAYPVDSLRSASFTQRMGGTAPSIMDYARFNYIAQPQDQGVLLYPGIGPYDKWAIKWGYTYFPGKKMDEETAVLNKWTVERAGNPLYFYGRQTSNPIDPRSQSEDLGDDAMKASAYGIQNLKRILPNIEKWTYEEGKAYENLQELYGEVINQFTRYMGHVKSNIGGIYENFKTYEQSGAVYTPVPKAVQQQAMDFIIKQAFATPTWLTATPSVKKFDDATLSTRIGRMQLVTLNSILEFSRLARVIDNTAKNGNQAYTINQLMSDLQNGIFTELGTGEKIDIYRRNLQRAYIERLRYLLTQDQSNVNEPTRIIVDYSDIRPMTRLALTNLQQSIKRALPRYNDALTKAHLNDALARIDLILNPKG